MSIVRKLTDWFDCSVKPVRKGVYQKLFDEFNDEDCEYQYWDGKRWYYGSSTVKETRSMFLSGKYNENIPYERPWRGILK